MAATPANTRAVRSAVEQSASPISPKWIGLSIDGTTSAALRAMQRTGRSDQSTLVRGILDQLLTGSIKRNDVADFYEQVWERLLPSKDQNILVKYRWSERAREALDSLAVDVLGAPNRSEMFRILVTYAGVRSGILKVEWTRAATIAVEFKKEPDRS